MGKPTLSKKSFGERLSEGIFMHRLRFTLALVAWLVSGLSYAQSSRDQRQLAEAEAEYYKILTFTPPKGEVLEAGAIEVFPDGKVAVGTRRGEIWLIDNAYDADPTKAKFTRFAHGLHEVLGL